MEGIRKAGVLVGARKELNLIEGSNITITASDDTDVGDNKIDITIAASGGSGAGHTIKEAGVALTQRAGLNFGSGFDLSDDAANDETDVALDLSEVAGGGDITWTGNTPAVVDDSHAHTSTTVTTHSTAHAHSALTGVGANDHHNQSHDHSAAGDGTSLSPATLILPGAVAPSQTAEGSVVWDTDNDVLTIGDGASRKTLLDTSHEAAADPHTGYRLESADHTHQSTGAQAGQLDHGLALTGLTDDDHTQYLKEKASGGAASEVPEHTHASAAQAGTVSHADLTNLTTGDPHTQYAQESWLLSGRKTADQTWTNDTNLANVTGMSFSVGANEEWMFDFYVFANGATTGDLKLAITTPTGATIIAGALGGMGQGTTSLVNADQHGILQASGGFPNPYGMAGTAQPNMIHVHGIVVNGANAGTIQLQAAQQTSDATATTVMANSHYRAIRVA